MRLEHEEDVLRADGRREDMMEDVEKAPDKM